MLVPIDMTFERHRGAESNLRRKWLLCWTQYRFKKAHSLLVPEVRPIVRG
jgi:hypothetical protein